MSPKENYLRAIYHNCPDYVPFGNECVIRLLPPIVERPDDTGLDAWNVSWTLEEKCTTGTYPTANKHLIENLNDWKDLIKIPDIEKLDWSQVKRKSENIDRDKNLVEGFCEMGTFERCYLLMGMENALIAFYEEPVKMAELCSVIADYKVRLLRAFNETCKLDIVWYGDDWGTQTNLFIPPEIWRKTIKPATKKIYDAIKSFGAIVNQHSCGKIESIFGDMVEIGAQIWNPCQPCNNLAELKKIFGARITFFGGIDSQFVLDRPYVTPEEVRVEVRKCIDAMAQGGGYIASPSHGVPYNPILLKAMTSEIKTYGRTVYKRS